MLTAETLFFKSMSFLSSISQMPNASSFLYLCFFASFWVLLHMQYLSYVSEPLQRHPWPTYYISSMNPLLGKRGF